MLHSDFLTKSKGLKTTTLTTGTLRDEPDGEGTVSSCATVDLQRNVDVSIQRTPNRIVLLVSDADGEDGEDDPVPPILVIPKHNVVVYLNENSPQYMTFNEPFPLIDMASKLMRMRDECAYCLTVEQLFERY